MTAVPSPPDNIKAVRRGVLQSAAIAMAMLILFSVYLILMYAQRPVPYSTLILPSGFFLYALIMLAAWWRTALEEPCAGPPCGNNASPWWTRTALMLLAIASLALFILHAFPNLLRGSPARFRSFAVPVAGMLMFFLYFAAAIAQSIDIRRLSRRLRDTLGVQLTGALPITASFGATIVMLFLVASPALILILVILILMLITMLLLSLSLLRLFIRLGQTLPATPSSPAGRGCHSPLASDR